jgi:8-oxo-dGTP diphosphatase
MLCKHPKVGVGVLIIQDGKLLLGQRKTQFSDNGTWGPPGGHLEFGESWEHCAAREVLEEVGIEIKNISFVTATNDIFSHDAHYISIFMRADYKSGTVQVMEPEKCAQWGWFECNKLPENLFLPLKQLIKNKLYELC